MAYAALCLGVFFVTALVNMTMISVFYHRALAHKGLELSPLTRWVVVDLGIWLTGIDPKGWVCMHRAHHKHSDTELDPHSPVHYGLIGVFVAQLKNYERTLIGLARGRERYTSLVPDLDFPVNRLNRRRMWVLPYVLHFAVALGLALAFDAWLLGACWFAGMMSHPIEGGLVNTLGHAFGGRNFETDDNSRNNVFAAAFILGEGYQNNHHRFPNSPRFSFRRTELDLGYGVCVVLELFGLVKIRREQLIPTPEQFAVDEARRLELAAAATTVEPVTDTAEPERELVAV